MVGLAGERDGDDGAGYGRPLGCEHRAGEILEMIESAGADKAKFLAYFRIEKIADLPAKSFQNAVNMLNAKARK